MNMCTICTAVSHKTEDHDEWTQTRIETFQWAVENAESGIRESKERISRLEEDKVLWLAKIENLKKEEAERCRPHG